MSVLSKVQHCFMSTFIAVISGDYSQVTYTSRLPQVAIPTYSIFTFIPLKYTEMGEAS